MAEDINHRKLGVGFFNFTWTLLDKKHRTREENDEMIHAAHASRFHWGKVGTAENLARGEWQISRVYSVLNRPEPALYHASRCVEICRENGIGDFDLAYAYEAMARASMIAGKRDDCEKYIRLAKEAEEKINEKEDRDLFTKDLATINTN